MTKEMAAIVKTIKEQIDAAIIGDRAVGWEDCAEALEELEDHCGEWAKQVRLEHENE